MRHYLGVKQSILASAVAGGTAQNPLSLHLRGGDVVFYDGVANEPCLEAFRHGSHDEGGSKSGCLASSTWTNAKS